MSDKANNNKNILISGYYGFDNFGDDAILKCIIDCLKDNIDDIDIIVISNNPKKTKKIYQVDSIKTFDFRAIIKAVKSCDFFISGGGSLLQDVTSLKSLLYYLSLMFLALFFGKKVFIFAQGIGPLNTFIGKTLVKNILKNVSMITVRDEKSYELLSEWGVYSILTSDPVWNMKIDKINGEKLNAVGVQLRGWETLKNDKIREIAQFIRERFNDTQIKILCLQKQLDEESCNILADELKNIGVDSQIIYYENIAQSIDETASLDCLIAMRFHAGLVGLLANVPTLLLSYDPKVTQLAKESSTPFVKVIDITKDNLLKKVETLYQSKDDTDLVSFCSKKALVARQNCILLIKHILADMG